MECIVCKSNLTDIFLVVDQKTYWECNTCDAKFLDKDHYIDRKAEKNHYLKHENYINDKHYKNFLSQLYNPLKKILSKNDEGLEFGCGHGPALAYMIKSDGFKIDLYDPFFYPNKKVFKKKYNFITCTEVVEHFYSPFKEFKILDNLLKAQGCLGIMTSFFNEKLSFKNWYYRRDPTHVVFYSQQTFKYIASEKNWDCYFVGKNVVLMKKK
tara:strand:+ start:363 stop:995 length:633 start_codon:yes stop_codon:yes gene_type:complete